MRTSKKGIGIFFISLVITFLILGSIFMLFFLYQKTANADTKQEDIVYNSPYTAKKNESMTMLIIGCERISSVPKLMLLLTYDAPSGTIYLSALPPKTLSTIEVKEDTLVGHYDYEGIRGSVNAVKSLLVTNVDRYARLDRTGIANLVDFLGGIEYEVKEDITYVDIDGNIEEFEKGKQLLDGRRVSALLFHETKDFVVDTNLQMELITLLSEQKFNESLASKFPNFISAFFYNSETNMNQYDFAIRQKGIIDKLQKKALVTKILPLDGEYNLVNSEFKPDDKCIQSISRVINKVYEEE